ncbi:Acetate-CoA ligase [ADP-forming] II subunit alpha [Pseudomonas reidholzensis]|uniref:Acetate-CoA ligase [ADP-forming] II subunit alpha n=1 Tax=Pseudomonas reidholzensis TaxID=1785162 RepID=A0A383RWJ7_9PSED|nr:acetate--CoA ligase family protein [Pseudomonas reidholzensis]SYX90856.1 Acetate-CoA ligase [ADP-forming] II subunit alpha [Pseudomonas reidholzensis]
MSTPHSLSSLFSPRSIALVGASDDPTRIGGRPLRYLRASGYAGEVFPINPNRDSVQGMPAYASIASLPQVPDVALLAVPAAATIESIRACADRGVGAAIVFSAGFAETSEEGKVMQQEITSIARESGMRVLGPNCLGVFNAQTGYYGTFSAIFDSAFVQPGPLAIVSQSGAYGSHLAHLARERGLGISHWVTTGNECDVDVAEALDWIVEQPQVKVVMAYAEGVRDGQRFLAALDKARRNQVAIVFMKVGRSQVGAQAVSSHTAALAGSDAVFDAVLRQYGVYRARTTAEQLDIAYAASRASSVSGNRLGIFTLSGGFGIQMADDAEDAGLAVTAMPASAQDELKRLLPYASPNNPVDATAQALTDLPLMSQFIRAMLDKGGYDLFAAILGSGPASPTFADSLRQAMAEATLDSPDCLKCLTLSAPAEIVRSYEAQGFLVYQDGSALINALGALVRFRAHFDQVGQTDPLPAAVPQLSIPQRAMSEHEAKSLLARAGIPFPAECLIAADQDPGAAARQLGFPLVMKISSADLPHKTEVGGVRLHLKDEDEVRQAMARMLESVRVKAPDAQIEGVTLAPMIGGGVETIVGVFSDPTMGPVVMFGLGGVYVEVLKDVTFRVAPFDQQEALRMIREIRGFAMLEGVRGAPPADIDALAQLLAQLSHFAAAHAGQFDSIDLNPVVVLPRGEGVLALDALIVPATLTA